MCMTGGRARRTTACPCPSRTACAECAILLSLHRHLEGPDEMCWIVRDTGSTCTWRNPTSAHAQHAIGDTERVLRVKQVQLISENNRLESEPLWTPCCTTTTDKVTRTAALCPPVRTKHCKLVAEVLANSTFQFLCCGACGHLTVMLWSSSLMLTC